MSAREIITPQYLAEARSREQIRLYAVQLHALCSAEWPNEYDFGFVEEEIREAAVLLALNLRRLIEIANLKGVLPKLQPDRMKASEEQEVSSDLWVQLGVLAHLQRLKCWVNFDNNVDRVLYLMINSDKESLCIDPNELVRAAFVLLKTPQTVYPFAERLGD